MKPLKWKVWRGSYIVQLQYYIINMVPIVRICIQLTLLFNCLLWGFVRSWWFLRNMVIVEFRFWAPVISAFLVLHLSYWVFVSEFGTPNSLLNGVIYVCCWCLLNLHSMNAYVLGYLVFDHPSSWVISWLALDTHNSCSVVLILSAWDAYLACCLVFIW